MIKQLKKVGNGNALFLDKAILELVGLREGSQVQITVHSGSIIISPANPEAVSSEDFEKALDRIAQKRSRALKRLAE